MLKLVVFRGDAVENEIRLTGATVKIGRDTRNDLVLDDSSKGVSRFHAEIRAQAGKYFVVDLKSRNGVWISGRRIKDKAELSLGMPVTVGSYELALEDDVSTADFGDEAPLVSPRTVVAAASANRREGSSRSATLAGMRSPVADTKQRQVLLWSVAAVAVLLVGGVTLVVVRNINRPALTVAAVDPPPPPTSQPPPELPVPVDPNRALIEQYLETARAKMESRDYVGALGDLELLLAQAPENAEALELKRRAEEASTATPPPSTSKPRPTERVETAAPAEEEAPGIPRRPSEVSADYTVRVRRIQGELAQGKSRLEKQEFAAAITHFRAVERDQPRYQGVDVLLKEATDKQQEALTKALDGGQQNEQAGKLPDARRWYVRALEIDPTSTGAREKETALRNRLILQATPLFNKANLARKAQETDEARRTYQQILDLLLPGDDIRDQAVKQLEALPR